MKKRKGKWSKHTRELFRKRLARRRALREQEPVSAGAGNPTEAYSKAEPERKWTKRERAAYEDGTSVGLEMRRSHERQLEEELEKLKSSNAQLVINARVKLAEVGAEFMTALSHAFGNLGVKP